MASLLFIYDRHPYEQPARHRSLYDSFTCTRETISAYIRIGKMVDPKWQYQSGSCSCSSCSLVDLSLNRCIPLLHGFHWRPWCRTRKLVNLVIHRLQMFSIPSWHDLLPDISASVRNGETLSLTRISKLKACTPLHKCRILLLYILVEVKFRWAKMFSGNSS